MSRHARALSSIPVLAALLLGSAACGGSSTPHRSDTAPVERTVTFTADSVTPSGEKIELAKGQQLRLHIKAAAPGEIHVHSSPEQQISYPAGTSEETIVIKTPGVVEVESHTLDKLIFQLEVR